VDVVVGGSGRSSRVVVLVKDVVFDFDFDELLEKKRILTGLYIHLHIAEREGPRTSKYRGWP